MTTSKGSDRPEVLVVGETATARALAALLDRAGVGVAIVSHDHGEVETHRPVVVPEQAFSVLDRIGTARGLRASGESIDRVLVHAGQTSTTVRPSSGASSPLLVDRRRLLGALDGRIPPDSVRETAPVRIANTGEDARVTFVNGDHERFDLVVVADGPISAARSTAGIEPVDGTELHQWLFRVHGDAADVEVPTEFWTADRFATVTPYADGIGVRILAGADPIDGPHREETLRAVAEGIGAPLPALVGTLDGRRPEYARVRVGDRSPARYRERVMVCGTALRPAGFASGIDPALGLLEARTLADAFAGTPNDVDGVLATYAAECARRWTAVCEAASDLTGTNGTYPPVDASDPLAELAGRRAVALGMVSDENASPIPGGDPDWS